MSQSDQRVDEDSVCCVSLFEKYIDSPPNDDHGQWLRRMTSNRWLRLTAYGIVAMGCAAIYFGWQQFQKILYQGNVYGWLCEPGWNYEVNGACEAQYAKAQMLYTVASSMEYIVGVIAGVLLDHLGPRSCGLVGMVVLLIGVVLLLVASEFFQVYILSMICLGGSVNLIAFPGLIAADLFPGHQALAISFVVACQIGCSLVAIILLEVWQAFPDLQMYHLFVGYLAFVWAPCCVLYFFFLPCRRRVIEIKESEPTLSSSTADIAAAEVQVESEIVYDQATSQHSTAHLSKRKIKEGSGPKTTTNQNTVVMKGDWNGFFFDLLTWDVELFAIYYIFQLLQFVYYPTTTMAMFGTKISAFAGYITPTQVFWGLLFGWLVDRVGTLPLCFVINTLNVFVFTFMLIGNYKLQYITPILSSIGQSFIYTSKYTYVTEIYTPCNFGKLAGYIGFLGGLFTLLNIPISASTNYQFWSAFFLGVSGFCYIILTTLSLRKRRLINLSKSIGTANTTTDLQKNLTIEMSQINKVE